MVREEYAGLCPCYEDVKAQGVKKAQDELDGAPIVKSFLDRLVAFGVRVTWKTRNGTESKNFKHVAVYFKYCPFCGKKLPAR